MKSIYKILKTLIRSFFPVKIIFKCEPFLRKLFYLFYIGRKFKCLVCNKQLRSFISHYNDKLCPNCGSSSRDRRLYNLITEKFLTNGMSILDFSPSRSYYRKFKKNASINYQASDLSNNFIAQHKFDLTKVELEDNIFDLIICYHVLEHIIDDNKAISELYRILKNECFCLIQTPFKEGEIYENSEIFTPEDRLKHFGQEDHVRIYSIKGLEKRLVDKGFKVEIKTFNEENNNYYGFSKVEHVLICKK